MSGTGPDQWATSGIYGSKIYIAKNVKRISRGFDALDLTRMVLHCVHRLEESWMDQDNYDALLTILCGRNILIAKSSIVGPESTCRLQIQSLHHMRRT